jgi:hypothetical protein
MESGINQIGTESFSSFKNSLVIIASFFGQSGEAANILRFSFRDFKRCLFFVSRASRMARYISSLIFLPKRVDFLFPLLICNWAMR